MNLIPLLKLIRWNEARGDYNVVYAGIKAADRPKAPPTTMTIQQVLDWQDSIDDRYPSEAAGAYQILEDTLRGVYVQAGLAKTSLFNVANQDRLATRLLEGRGLARFVEGKMSETDFCNALAKEWASLPVVTDVRRGKRTIRAGQSYYAGDGLNKAHCSVKELREAVAAIKARTVTPPRKPEPALVEPTPVPATSSKSGGKGGAAREIIIPRRSQEI